MLMMLQFFGSALVLWEHGTGAKFADNKISAVNTFAAAGQQENNS